MKSTLLATIVVLLATSATAQDRPTSGLLFSEAERHSLSYRCVSQQTSRLECDFTQVTVRPKSVPSELPSIISKARESFRTEKPLTKQECTSYKDFLAVLEGRKAPPKPDVLAAMTAIAKADNQRLVKSLVDYCESPNEQTFLALVRFGHDKDCRTCTISSNTFRQTFRALPSTGRFPVWIADSEPEGTCGVTQLSRFEPEESSVTQGKFALWKYVARKAVTNPTAEFMPGMKCGDLDEKPYLYDWRSNEHQISCDYIKFGAI